MFLKKQINLIKETFLLEGVRKYSINISMLFIARILVLCMTTITSIAVARYLGPEDFGNLNYLISFVVLFSFIIHFGLDGILGRVLLESPEDKDKILTTAFGLKVIGGILGSVICTTSFYFFNNETGLTLFVFLISLNFIFQAFNVIETYYQVHLQGKTIFKIQIFASVISSLIKVALIIFQSDYHVFALMYSVDFLINALLFASFYFFDFKNKVTWSFDLNYAMSLIKQSWPLILSSAFYYIYLRFDQVIIKSVLGIRDLGIYSASVKITELAYLIPTILGSGLMTALINAKKSNDKITYQKRTRQIYLLFFWSSFISSTIIFFLSPLLISTLFGEQYLNSIAILRIYIWTTLSVAITTGLHNFLISENKTIIIAKSGFIGALTNIVLNIILIPQIGLIGSAIASVTSYLVIPFSILCFKESKSQRKAIIDGILFRFRKEYEQ